MTKDWGERAHWQTEQGTINQDSMVKQGEKDIVETGTKWKGAQGSEVHVRLKSSSWQASASWCPGSSYQLQPGSVLIPVESPNKSPIYFHCCTNWLMWLFQDLFDNSRNNRNIYMQRKCVCVYDSPLGSVFSRIEVPVPASWWIEVFHLASLLVPQRNLWQDRCLQPTEALNWTPKNGKL